MSTQGGKKGGISKTQLDAYYASAPKGTKRQSIEEIVKKHNGNVDRITHEISALWDVHDSQKNSNQSADAGWTDVKKRGNKVKDKKSDQRQFNTGRGRGSSRRAPNDARGGRTQANDKGVRNANPRNARKPVNPPRQQQAPVAPKPQPVREVQPQDEPKELNQTEKAPLTDATPSASGAPKNSWAGGVPFSERLRLQEEERKKNAELKVKMQGQSKQVAAKAEAVPAKVVKSPEEQAKANEQAFPQLQSKGKGAAGEVSMETTDENSAAPTNVAVSWAKKAMQQPKPKTAAPTPVAEEPKATEPKEQARPSKKTPTQQNRKSAAPAKAASPVVAPTADVTNPPVSTKTAPAKKASPVKEPAKQPSSPGSFVKLPAGFSESDKFSFGGFGLDANQKQDAPVSIGAWGAVSAKSTESTEPATSSPPAENKNIKALDSPQKALINGLMSSSPQKDNAPIMRHVPENVPVNAADYESQARAQADAGAKAEAANIEQQTKKEVEQLVAQQQQKPAVREVAKQAAAPAQPQVPVQQQVFQQQQQQGYAQQQVQQQQARFNNNAQGKRKQQKNVRNNKQQQYSRGDQNNSVAPGQGFPDASHGYQQQDLYGYQNPYPEPVVYQGQAYSATGNFVQQPSSDYYSNNDAQFGNPPPGMENQQPKDNNTDVNRPAGDANQNQLGGVQQHGVPQQHGNVRNHNMQQNHPQMQQAAANAPGNPGFTSSPNPPPYNQANFSNNPPGMAPNHPYQMPYPYFAPQGYQPYHSYQPYQRSNIPFNQVNQRAMYEQSNPNYQMNEQMYDQNFAQQNVNQNNPTDQADAAHPSVMDSNAQTKAQPPGVNAGIANQNAGMNAPAGFSQQPQQFNQNFVGNQYPAHSYAVIPPSHPQIHQYQQQQQPQQHYRNNTNNWQHN